MMHVRLVLSTVSLTSLGLPAASVWRGGTGGQQSQHHCECVCTYICVLCIYFEFLEYIYQIKSIIGKKVSFNCIYKCTSKHFTCAIITGSTLHAYIVKVANLVTSFAYRNWSPLRLSIN